MKYKKWVKAIGISALLAIPSLCQARNFSFEINPTYVGEIHAGYRTTTKVSGWDTYSGQAQLGTLQGVSFNDYLDVMIGIDACMLTHYYSGNGLRFAMTTYLDMRPSFPVNERFKVFLDLGLGAFYGIHATPELGHGFFCQFGPGFRYRKFNLSLGLQSIGSGQGTVGFFSKIGIYF